MLLTCLSELVRLSWQALSGITASPESIFGAFASRSRDRISVEGNRRLHILSPQGRKIGENVFDGIASSQAGQHGTKRNPGAAKNGLAAANFRVPYDPVFLLHQRISLP